MPDALSSMAQRAARLTPTLLLLIASACSTPTTPSSPGGGANPTLPAPSIVAGEMLELTNSERTRGGLAVLLENAQLTQAAQIQADQMVAAGRIAHVLPEARYPTMEERLAAAGYRWRAAGENVASGHRNAAHVLEAWMETDGHRANILNGTFTEIGVGYAVDKTGRQYYVQLFGRPL